MENTWCRLSEDLLESEYWKALETSVVDEPASHSEFEVLSIDGTLRVMRHIKGQADYRTSGGKRNAQPRPDSEAKRKVLTVIGRTGATLAFKTILSENAEDIRGAFQEEFKEEHLSQCRYLMSDCPGRELWKQMKKVLPNLEIISKDPIHLVINYELQFAKRKSSGSRTLRLIMGKFNKIRPRLSPTFWGPAYHGDLKEVTEFTEEEKKWNQRIGLCSTPLRTAKKILADLNWEVPWETRLQFNKAVAALTAQNRIAVGRQTNQQSKVLANLLMTGCMAPQCEWLFNNLRARHGVALRKVRLLGSGTSPNEAAHSCVNRWFRNLGEPHKETLESSLRYCKVASLLCHNSALYRPTLTQMRRAEILPMLVRQVGMSPEQWRRHLDRPVKFPKEEVKEETRQLIKIAKRPAMEKSAIPGRRPLLP